MDELNLDIDRIIDLAEMARHNLQFLGSLQVPSCQTEICHNIAQGNLDLLLMLTRAANDKIPIQYKIEGV